MSEDFVGPGEGWEREIDTPTCLTLMLYNHGWKHGKTPRYYPLAVHIGPDPASVSTSVCTVESAVIDPSLVTPLLKSGQYPPTRFYSKFPFLPVSSVILLF